MGRLLSGLLILLVWLGPAQAWADDVHVSASLDRPIVARNDTATLSVTVTGSEDVDQPHLPPLSGFAVRATEQAQNVTIVNGQMSSSVTYRYVLQPTTVGSFTIGPIEVQAQGHSVASQPLHIQVTAAGSPSPASAAAPPGEDAPRGAAFATADIDNSTPYVGQAVTYTLRFYHRPGVTLAGAGQPPETTGFVTEDLKPEKAYTQEVDGQPYQVNEVRMALFPTSAGRHDIGPAHLQYRAPLGLSGEWNDDVIGLLGGNDLQSVTTQTIPVTVRPTPAAGRPDDFTGGVGHFTLTAGLDAPNGAHVGQAVTLNLTVQGSGNVKLVQAPPLPPLPAWKVYDTVATSHTTVSQGQVTGTRQFAVSLVPTQAGHLSIPPISMATLDPTTGRYQSLSTSPLDIAVGPAPAGSTVAVPATGPSSEVETDPMRPIHETSSLSTPSDLVARPAFWALLGGPLCVLGAAWVRWGRRPRPARPDAALHQARAQLRQGLPVADWPPVLYGYLTDKLGQSTMGMSTRDLSAVLEAHGATSAEVQRLEALLSQAGQARYAPTRPAVDSASWTEADTLLLDLERSLK